MKKSNRAFTLAEILVVLTIIGVMAAILIPSLVAKVERQAWLTALKKTYSTLENARKLTSLDYGGDISPLFANDDTDGNLALQAFAKHLNIFKNCGTEKGCLYDDVKVWNADATFPWESDEDATGGKAILNDGTIVSFRGHGTDGDDEACQHNMDDYNAAPAYRYSCGNIMVDINGMKGPNTYGKDVFAFDITRDGIYPEGTNAGMYLDGICINEGMRCAAKAIKDGNMNYLDSKPDASLPVGPIISG